jgi:hypothetical protein
MNFNLIEGPITTPGVIRWVNSLERKLKGEIKQRSNIFWLNRKGKNGQIYNFLKDPTEDIEKKQVQFFAKAGIPWMGHPTELKLQSDSNFSITCYIHADTRYPYNVAFSKNNEIMALR